MGSERRQRSRKFWAVIVLVPGVILAVLAGLSWTRGPVPSNSTPATHPGATPAWATHIRNMDSALGQGAIRAAEANWLAAHLGAHRSAAWEAWIAVGDAALRLGDVNEYRPNSIIHARRAYKKAVLMAQNQNSQRGVLAAADAFAALGDQQLADELRALAQRLSSPRG